MTALRNESIRTYFQLVCEEGNPQGAVIRTEVLNCEVWSVGDASLGEETDLLLSPSAEVAWHLFSDWWGSFVVENPPDSTEEAGDWGSVPGSGRSPGIGDSNPLQYSCLENPLDGGAWSMRSILSMRSQSRRQQHTHTHIDLFRYSPPTNILIDVKELFPCYSGFSQRGQATCLRWHSVWLAEPRLSRNLSDSSSWEPLCCLLLLPLPPGCCLD